MREDSQPPKKEHLLASSSRKAKSTNAPSKKLQKSIKKNLSSAFTPIDEDNVLLNLSIEKMSSISESVDVDDSTVEMSKTSSNSNQTLVSDKAEVLQPPEESVGISPISEAFVFPEEQPHESMESYIASLNQFVSPSSITLGSVEMTPFSSLSPAESTTLSSVRTVEMTPSSSPITAESAAVFVASATCDGATVEEADTFNKNLLVKHLRKSMSQVLHSAEVDIQYKKLLDALVKMVIQEFYSLHEERERVAVLFSKKVEIVLLSFVLLFLVIFSGFMVFSESSYYGPPPT